MSKTNATRPIVPAPERETCANCRFFDAPQMICRRYPPRCIVMPVPQRALTPQPMATGQLALGSAWPQTNPQFFCGEHERKHDG